MSASQISGLAEALNRSPATVKSIVQTARKTFAENAGRYVELHMESAAGAFAEGDYETAAKASQWALSNIAEDGVRVVDRPDDAPGAPKVVIGIQLGGVGKAMPVVAAVEGAVVVVEPPALPEPEPDPQ